MIANAALASVARNVLRNVFLGAAAACSILLSIPVPGQDSPTTVPVTSLPVREVTVFKDGHAYVLREAPVPVDRVDGKIVLDDLPAPLLGTFWPFATGETRLVSARSGRDTVSAAVPATDLLQIAKANVGKDVVVVVGDELAIAGRLIAVPRHEQNGELLLVQTVTGTRALPLARVRDLEVRGEFEDTFLREQQRERLTLELAAGGGGAEDKIGLMYVQRGLRWIPSYRFDIDGDGTAAVQMEATLVNDLIDLESATVHLVVGVPRFEFEGMVDAIALQQEVAQVAASARTPSFSNLLSNGLMTQVAGYAAESGPPGQRPPAAGEGAEDLYVYTLEDVTLARGERLVVPVSSFDLPYRDVYRLDVPFSPPMEVRDGLQGQRVLELARQLAAPKVWHVLRFDNTTKAPLTTAPALVLRRGRVLAQGRMLYTPSGASTDLEINAAIDIRVETDERETNRTAVRLVGDDYQRVDLHGSIQLSNHRSEAATIEIRRRVLGLVDRAGPGGELRQLDLVQLHSGSQTPGWLSWWSWPHWWFRHNGFGEFRWQVELPAGGETEIDADWHYFWR